MKIAITTVVVIGALLLGAISCLTFPLLKRDYEPLEFSKRADISIGENPTYGLFYVPVKIGTPPVTYNLCLQTGSSDVVLFDKSCTDCQASPHRYDPKRSSTSKGIDCKGDHYFCHCGPANSCIVQTSYALEPANGTLYSDSLFWAGTSVTITVGSLFSAYPDFVPAGMDGMIGFNTELDSDWNAPSPFVEWAFRNNLPYTFSMCLLPKGAYLTIGEDLSGPTSPYQWIGLTGAADFVQINNITVNGMDLANFDNALAKTIIDTGSPTVTLPSPTFYTFASILRKMCTTVNLVGVCKEPKGKSLLDGICFDMTPADIAAFPSMIFNIQSVKPLELASSFYLMPNGNSTTSQCLGVQPVDPVYLPTLGIAFLQAFNVALDPFNSLAGFADLSTCNN